MSLLPLLTEEDLQILKDEVDCIWHANICISILKMHTVVIRLGTKGALLATT